jgi:hypothetical protein
VNRNRRSGLGLLLALVVLTAACSSKTHKPATPPASTRPPTTASTSRASTSTTSSSTTTTTTTRPPTGRRLYPGYLPSGVGPGVLWSYADHMIDRGYTQSYYGAANAAGKPAELVIGERTAGLAGAPAKLAGIDVMIWRSNTASNPVLAVTAKLSGHDVTLVSYALSEQDLGRVLGGLAPRPTGRGWDTRVLPAGLRLFGEGEQTPQPADVYYFLKFGSFARPAVSVAVQPGALQPEDACACNPGLRRSLSTTTINGQPAVVIDRSDTYGIPGSSFEVDWQYAPDIVVSVSVYRFDEKEAKRIATSLAAADPATWSALRCVNAAGTTVSCTSQPQVPARG